jgi:uncharacterized protein
METRNSRNPGARRIQGFGTSLFDFLISIFLFFFAIGCGAPGEPTPPVPQVPVAITDLTAQQAGDAVQLTFTLPSKTVSGGRLSEPPAIEILRGALKPDGSADPKSFRVIETIPGALVGEYRSADKVQIPSRVSPDDLRAYPGAAIAYRVRTRASRKRASGDSNTAIIPIRPAPERIASLHAEVTESAIELSWSAPTHTSSGASLPPISEYRVYRGELDPGSADSAAKELSQAKWKSALALLASTPTNSYRDAVFDFGKTYLYTVRTVISADGRTVESADSVPAIVTPRDIFPPAVPEGLVGTVVRSEPNGAPEVDLSWSINGETDLAGYRVYRSEQQGTPGQLVTPDLLPSPAYRDTSVQPGHVYWYSVTAVDRSGNESGPSAPVAVDVAQPSP